MLFRRAVPSDLEQILVIIREARIAIATLKIDQWQDGYPNAALLEEDIRLSRAFVCDENGTAVAYVVLSTEPESVYASIEGAWHWDDRYLTIHRMAVNDACRHRGAAQRILEGAKAYARSLGICVLRVDTHPGNRVMRRFLEKNGFLPCGTVVYTVKKGDPFRIAYDLRLEEA